ncbi:MAG: hypothetical protein ABIQ39_06760, partial [Ilumatobacteraceae bacterium]
AQREPLLELLEVIAAASQGQLVEGDLELLKVLIGGASANAMARQLRVSPRTVRNRRDAVVHRLRAAVAA